MAKVFLLKWNFKKIQLKKFNLFEKSESDGQQFFCWALQAMKL